MQKKTKFIAAGVAALAVVAIGAAGIAHADGHRFGRGHHGPGMGGPGGFDFGGPKAMMAFFDTDKDGKLTQAEIDAKVAAEYQSANTDSQAGVSIAEFEPWFWKTQRERMVRAFQKLDADGDGLISEAEAKEPVASIVAHLDRNDDGALSIEDRPERGEHGKRHHRGPKPGDDDAPEMPGDAE